eukprot:TRINITY_DN31647_c0_g1_i2.p2 TRINITY_DN31647_c0_g1~~TRINITY_DN31647_c0_g1_i2.p2  ORF type:complete len:190 (-),score=38.46 TRINITY_DN31647_c0_g1_i2:64-633(-)
MQKLDDPAPSASPAAGSTLEASIDEICDMAISMVQDRRSFLKKTLANHRPSPPPRSQALSPSELRPRMLASSLSILHRLGLEDVHLLNRGPALAEADSSLREFFAWEQETHRRDNPDDCEPSQVVVDMGAIKTAVESISLARPPSMPSNLQCKCRDCLLYTSDAADEEDSVDLGGRRIIKKKNIDTENR